MLICFNDIYKSIRVVRVFEMKAILQFKLVNATVSGDK